MTSGRNVKPPRFDAVLFDFGGTLDADGVPSLEQFLRAYRATGGRRSPAEFEGIFRASDRQLADHPEIRRLGFRDTIHVQAQLIARLLGDHEVDGTRIAAHVYDDALAIVQRNRAILGDLQARGTRTALVSNFTGNLECCIIELGLAPVLDAVIDSAVVGVRKPDPQIFALAREAIGVEPSRALMVGDNPFADIRGAGAIGMATCWLAPLSRDVPPGCDPTFRIESLRDLPAVVEHATRSDQAGARPCTA